MTRTRDPRSPLPRDPDVDRRREFLYPYRVLTEDGATLALSASTLTEFAGVYAWNLGENPQAGVVNSVTSECWRENGWAKRHLIRPLAIGALGVAPH